MAVAAGLPVDLGGGGALLSDHQPRKFNSSHQELSDNRLGREVPVFISKIFEIFSTAGFSEVCSWSQFGDKIIIKKVADFSALILPKYFKHNNFNSFVRQLNM